MALVVLDVGKTHSKLSLWDRAGVMLARTSYKNKIILQDDMKHLDVSGIDIWLQESLTSFQQIAPIQAIFPIAHGGAAAIICSDKLLELPVDYEQDYPNDVHDAYGALRDDFTKTGSPSLPNGLNLGRQLFHRLGALAPLPDDTSIVPWPQYWAWRLSGVLANEVSSMGCHSDLWFPGSNQPSDLARKIGVADRLAPLFRADDVLGTITKDWADRTGLSQETSVYCGTHDSNAALIAARGFDEIGAHEATIVSTGTWFVAMRSLNEDAPLVHTQLPEGRDCLINIDPFGAPVLSARFMGGREIEAQVGLDGHQVDTLADQPALLAAVPDIVGRNQMLLPTTAAGTGPFPFCQSAWIDKPTDAFALGAAVCLYAALVVDQSLALIGTKQRILIEGRFALADVFVRALASLVPEIEVYIAKDHHDVALGALRLMDPTIKPAGSLSRVIPLDIDLTAYKSNWYAAILDQKVAA